ncbi:MAG: trypsin-like serine protease [Crenarchaeota archaeon]|nr:trypsin-like serine protease [Thermoproteota archaeon]
MIFLLLVALCSSLVNNTTFGITGNYTADSTGYVGVVVLFSDTDRTELRGYATGFLISSRVMITAGHNLIEPTAAVSVCFDDGPIPYEIDEEGKIVDFDADKIYEADRFEVYPKYIPTLAGNQEFATSDIGIIILKEEVDGFTDFHLLLPEENFADTLSAKTDLRVIGYGLQYQVTPKKNPENSWVGTVSRNSAIVQLVNNNFAGGDKYLKLTANNGQDRGGITFGDSGGPVIYSSDEGEMVLAVNAFVSSDNCRGVSYHTRLDVQQVQEWINGYLE